MIKAKTHGGFLISQIRHLSGRIWEKLLKESGVDIFNGAQGRILYILWEHGNLTITEIGKLTSLAKTTLTSMLDRMEASGLVKRVPDKINRRQIFIHVTEKAKQYRDKYDWLCDEMNEKFYQEFTEAEVKEFEDKLRKIVKNLSKTENIKMEERKMANKELVKIIEKFAESGWDVIDAPAKKWLAAGESADITAELVKAVQKADNDCGSCGCEFDPLYKRVLEMLQVA